MIVSPPPATVHANENRVELEDRPPFQPKGSACERCLYLSWDLSLVRSPGLGVSATWEPKTCVSGYGIHVSSRNIEWCIPSPYWYKLLLRSSLSSHPPLLQNILSFMLPIVRHSPSGVGMIVSSPFVTVHANENRMELEDWPPCQQKGSACEHCLYLSWDFSLIRSPGLGGVTAGWESMTCVSG